VLDSFNRICVIFSLEENTYSKLYDIISEDQTFRRRFIIPHNLNGLPVKLEPLKEKEAKELVIDSVKNWAIKNNADSSYFENLHESWPFTSEALTLAWKIAPVPGSMLDICRKCLEYKVTLNRNSSPNNVFTITEEDVAICLHTTGYLSEIEISNKLLTKIDFLTSKNTSNDRILALSQKTSQKLNYNLDLEFLKKALHKFFEHLDFTVKEDGRSDLIIGTIFEDFERWVGIKLVDGTRISKKDTKDIYIDFQNSTINSAIFIGVHDSDGDVMIRHEEDGFSDPHTSLATAIGSKAISKEDAFAIIGMLDIENDDYDKLVYHLDRRLNLKPYFEGVRFTTKSQSGVNN
jgi:hypothetical protein